MDIRGRTLATFTDVKSPCHLSSDSEGHVMAVDSDNHRILLLSSQLQLQRILIDNTDFIVKLWWPKQLSYNELTSQLYVVHSSSEEWSQSDVISLLNLR